jgi:hypothetical protein
MKTTTKNDNFDGKDDRKSIATAKNRNQKPDDGETKVQKKVDGKERVKSQTTNKQKGRNDHADEARLRPFVLFTTMKQLRRPQRH